MRNNKAVILVDHGSRNLQSHLELVDLTNKLKEKLGEVSLFCCHMEIAEPLLSDILIDCAKNGFEKIEVLPLFLFTGKHLSVDIPAIIKNFCDENPDLEVAILNNLGTDLLFIEYLNNRLK